MVAGRIRVVVHRVGAWVVGVDRLWLIDDHALGLVIRNVNDVIAYRLYFDDPLIVRNSLVFVCLEVARGIGTVTKRLYRCDQVILLRDHRFAKFPGPVKIVIHQLDDLRVVEQGNDRLIPFIVGLQRWIVFKLFQKTGRLDNLEGIS